MRCSVLQCVAMCCSVLQRVAACCSVSYWKTRMCWHLHILICAGIRIYTSVYWSTKISMKIFLITNFDNLVYVQIFFLPHVIFLVTYMYIYIHIHSPRFHRFCSQWTPSRQSMFLQMFTLLYIFFSATSHLLFQPFLHGSFSTGFVDGGLHPSSLFLANIHNVLYCDIFCQHNVAFFSINMSLWVLLTVLWTTLSQKSIFLPIFFA